MQKNYIKSFDNSSLTLRVILKSGNKKWTRCISKTSYWVLQKRGCSGQLDYFGLNLGSKLIHPFKKLSIHFKELSVKPIHLI